jgi:hypothetical protein
VAIDRAVREQIDEGYALANAVLKANRDLVLRSAALLLESETLDGDQLDVISSGVDRALVQSPRGEWKNPGLTDPGSRRSSPFGGMEGGYGMGS